MHTRQNETAGNGRPFRRAALLGLACWAGSGLCGCAGFWDEVTSREFRVRNLFHHPDPIAVLRESNDGDQRQKALLALREPKLHGGTDQDQDEVLRILTETALNDRQPICRVAAIQTLSRFKDPRAAQVLENAYFQAGNFKPVGNVQPVGFNATGTFLPEAATVIRCKAIEGMAETGNPSSVELLVRVLRQPAGEGTEGERQTLIGERIAAARGLGHYNVPQGTASLVWVLETEKDVALRDAAHQSLQKISGNRKVPADGKAWREALSGSPAPRESAPSALPSPGAFPERN